jgi:hypothetical protein
MASLLWHIPHNCYHWGPNTCDGFTSVTHSIYRMRQASFLSDKIYSYQKRKLASRTTLRREALTNVMVSVVWHIPYNSLARHNPYNCYHAAPILVMASLVQHIPYNIYLYVRIDIKCRQIQLTSHWVQFSSQGNFDPFSWNKNYFLVSLFVCFTIFCAVIVIYLYSTIAHPHGFAVLGTSGL